MKFKLTLSVLSPAEIVAGFDVELDPRVGKAREQEKAARRESVDALSHFEKLSTRVDALKVDVPAGRGSLDELQDALRAQQASSLTLAGFKARIVDADRAIEAALKLARADVIQEAGRRRDELQAVADQLRPVLESLRDAESALDSIVVKLGQRSGVLPVSWPTSVDDEASTFHGRAALVSPGGTNPRPS